MKLFLGLGNPGQEYVNNRHNTGFQLVEALAKINSCEWHASPKLFAQVAKPAAQDILYAKPDIFMNESGRAARALLDYYKIKLTDFILAHDDLDLPLGEYQISKKSPHDHNGVLSVEQSLGQKDFTRIRIGIDNRDPDNRVPGDRYVLAKFSTNEQNIINNTIQKIINTL